MNTRRWNGSACLAWAKSLRGKTREGTAIHLTSHTRLHSLCLSRTHHLTHCRYGESVPDRTTAFRLSSIGIGLRRLPMRSCLPGPQSNAHTASLENCPRGRRGSRDENVKEKKVKLFFKIVSNAGVRAVVARVTFLLHPASLWRMSRGEGRRNPFAERRRTVRSPNFGLKT